MKIKITLFKKDLINMSNLDLHRVMNGSYTRHTKEMALRIVNLRRLKANCA